MRHGVVTHLVDVEVVLVGPVARRRDNPDALGHLGHLGDVVARHSDDLGAGPQHLEKDRRATGDLADLRGQRSPDCDPHLAAPQVDRHGRHAMTA